VAAVAVQDLAAELVDPEAAAAPVGAGARAPVEAYGKREKLPAEAVEAVELVRVAGDQEAVAERVVVAKAPAAVGEAVEALEVDLAAEAVEGAQAARVDLEVEAPGAELAGVELGAPAGLEVDPAAAGEGVEALEVDLAAEAPAAVAARVGLEVDPAAAGEGVEALAVDLAAEAPALVAARVDLEAAEVQVVRVAAVRLAAEARLPSLANG
jgi:hypothetical protein